MDPLRLKKFSEIGLFCLFAGLFLAALPALGFGNVGTGLTLLVAAFLIGLLLIWTGILKEVFPSYGLKYQLISTLVLEAVAQL